MVGWFEVQLAPLSGKASGAGDRLEHKLQEVDAGLAVHRLGDEVVEFASRAISRENPGGVS
jgi:hypothetical protein